MKDLKFRVMLKDGTWRYGKYPWIFPEMSNTVLVMSDFWNLMTWPETRRETLGEYAGFKDRNGKEIYGDDIIVHPLCVKQPHLADESCEHFIGKISYEPDRGQWFAIGSPSQKSGRVMELTQSYKFKIIGNIWQNPELWKV
jgi:uncharacterized phage protein (TIGR01671 family)